MIEHDEKIRQLCKYSELPGDFRGHRLRWTGEIHGKEEISIMEKIKKKLAFKAEDLPEEPREDGGPSLEGCEGDGSDESELKSC